MSASKETYQMLLDESGDDGSGQDFGSKESMANWFTTAGIMGHKEDIAKLEKIYDTIIKKYFTDEGIEIPPKFKLRHYQMRARRGLYKQLNWDQRQKMRGDMFSAIKSSNCQIVSVTSHKRCDYLQTHKDIGVRAYTLLLCMESFLRFLEENNGLGEIVYEQFSKHVRQKTMRDVIKMQRDSEFSNTKKRDKIRKFITNGKPGTVNALSFADFVAYLSQSMVVNGGKSKVEWDRIVEKYYTNSCKIIGRGQPLGHHF